MFKNYSIINKITEIKKTTDHNSNQNIQLTQIA